MNYYNYLKPSDTARTINYNEINNLEFSNIREEVARTASTMLWGQGYTVNILRNKKIDDELTQEWQKIEEANEYYKICLRLENDLSIYGNGILLINRTKNNTIKIGMANPKYFNNIAKVNTFDLVGAVIQRHVKHDLHNWIIRETYDNKKITREFYHEAQAHSIQLYNKNIDIPKELQLPEVEYHNFGIVPIHQFLNKQQNIFNVNNWEQLSDCYTVNNIIRIVNTIQAQSLKECLLNTTRIIGNFSPAQILQYQNTAVNVKSLFFSDLLLNTPQSENQSPITINQGNPSFQNYDEHIKNLLRLIYRGAGYTYIQSGDSMSSNAETIYLHSSDFRTTREKKVLREKDHAIFIKKILIAAGLIEFTEDIQVFFSIKENVIMSESQKIDNNIRLIDAGLIPKWVALSQIMGLNEEQAKNLVIESEEERSQAIDKMNEQANSLMNNNPEEFEDTTKKEIANND